MPARIARLKRRSEFLRVAGARRKWAAPGLVLQARKHDAVETGEAAEAAPPRIGFTASRKVGIAVQRNRARRRLRAAAAELMPRHALPGHDYVLIARAETATRPWPELLGDLEAALRRVRAWRDGEGATAGSNAGGSTAGRV
jgi:ribonuclease P protein component